MKYKTKTEQEILSQPPAVDRDESDGILKEWEAEGDGKKHVVIWYYDDGDYQSSAFGLSVMDGELYEFSGSHCSCYGYEGQFGPVAADLPALAMRVLDSKYQEQWHRDLAVFIGATKEA